ncbi:MAG: DUF2268 domain-containing putative Zn-dependent protease [Candidatus Nanohaloarchaea archaeon]
MEYTIKPEKHELERARRAAKEALESSKTVLEKEQDVEVFLAGDGRESVREKMNGSQGRTYSPTTVTASFCPEAEGWEDALKRTIAHEYAHAYFYEEKPKAEFLWQWLLEEALTQNFSEKIYPGIESPMRQRFSREEVGEYWSDVKEVLGEEIGGWYEHQLFMGGESFPRWIGYSAAYLIGQKLLEEHDLEDFPGLERSDVIEAGDRLFG